MSENKKKELLEEENSKNKTELATRIAQQSHKVQRSYERLESRLFKAMRGFSSFIDRLLFNQKHAKLTSLLLAIVLYGVVNYNTMAAVIAKPMEYSRTLEDVEVVGRYNSDTFELSGLEETVDVVITGDATSVTNALSSNGVVIADLEGLTEGNHEVKLKGEGFGDGVKVTIDPSNCLITLKKKTTAQFDLSYDFIHTSEMENIYSPGIPEFETTKVNVRASKDTLDTIAFVKALIDVSGQVDTFEQDAILVAYDSSGNVVQADIIPNTIHVTVPVTSPNKTVAIEVQVTGEIPDDKAISEITTDQQTVTIYGPDNVLREIDKVIVSLNAATITKDSTILRPIVLPTGVTSSNINQITVMVTLDDMETKTINDVPIQYINNNNNYKASQPDNITTVSVVVKGTEKNLENISADSINVYIDMKDATPGLQEFQLFIDQPTDGLVHYELKESTYELNVLGETEGEEEDTSGDG